MTEFWTHFLAIFSDPAHMAVEVLNTFIIDVLVLGVLWPAVRRAIRREHRAIDSEHGYIHLEDGRPAGPEHPDCWLDLPVPYSLTDKGKATAPGV